MNGMQTDIPGMFMRGGTSRGPFFNAADLPADIEEVVVLDRGRIVHRGRSADLLADEAQHSLSGAEGELS